MPLTYDGARAVSFSRDSDGKHERLRQWCEKHGIDFEQWKRQHGLTGLHQREHKRNRWTAGRHGLTIASEVNSDESAATVGARGHEVIATARRTGATVVIIPRLRRLGVGLAQVYWRQHLEHAGLTIVSENDRENSILRCEPSPRRDKDLWQIAGDDQYEWEQNKERLRRAHTNHHEQPHWQQTLQFIAERPHVNGPQLARILEHRGYKTLTGRTNWTKMQVWRARQELAAGNHAGAVTG